MRSCEVAIISPDNIYIYILCYYVSLLPTKKIYISRIKNLLGTPTLRKSGCSTNIFKAVCASKTEASAFQDRGFGHVGDGWEFLCGRILVGFIEIDYGDYYGIIGIDDRDD